MSITEKKLNEAIEIPFKQAIEKIRQEELSLSDMYVCVRFEDSSIIIYDDMNRILEQTVIDEWEALKDEPDGSVEQIISSLRVVLNGKGMRKVFESLDIVGPFSVILVNEEHEQIEELSVFDKDTFFLDDDLLKNWDKDLDDFFEKLMSDVK